MTAIRNPFLSAMAAAVLCLGLVAPSSGAMAQQVVRVGVGSDAVQSLSLPRGESAVIELPVDARDVMVSNPAVADAVLQSPRRIVLMGLAPGMRAMSLPVSQDTGAGGFILPGDRVDVIMSRRAEESVDGREGYVTATVLRNIRVLAVGETTEAGDEQNVAGSNATLEVGPREAEVLAFAQAQGDLYLVLRSYADAQEASGAAISPTTRAESGGPQTVRVFRNGEVTEVPVG